MDEIVSKRSNTHLKPIRVSRRDEREGARAWFCLVRFNGADLEVDDRLPIGAAPIGEVVESAIALKNKPPPLPLSNTTGCFLHEPALLQDRHLLETCLPLVNDT